MADQGLRAHEGRAGLDPAGTDGTIDVWILAGQSNAVGDNQADGTPMPPAAAPLPGLLLMYDSGGAWRDAAPSVHAGVHGYDRTDSCGPDMAFGRTLLALGLSARVGFVPTARGATNLFRDWRPCEGGGGGGREGGNGGGGGRYAGGGGQYGGGGGRYGGGGGRYGSGRGRYGGGDGRCYDAMIARTRAALAAPVPGGGACRLRGMIWVQGEADADERAGPGPALSYGANFAAFAAAVRRDLAAHHPQLPILMGVMSTAKRGCFPHIEAVRQAQLALPPLGALVRVDLEGLEFFEQFGPFHVHLTKRGACELGAALARAHAAASLTSGRPPHP